MPGRTIWINAGEASGDMHGAGLMRALRTIEPEVAFTGMGGPAMEKEGFATLHPMSLISIVGLPAIFSALPRILSLLSAVKKELARLRPDGVVLIDCPEFNFRVARIADRLGIPVYYYVSPQVWAWRPWRVRFLKRHVRTVLCFLPFEKDFYAARGMEVDFVGHPLLDELDLESLDRAEPDPGRIGILPGSRTSEVDTLLPLFLETAVRLKKQRPDLTFTVVRAPTVDRSLLEHRLSPAGERGFRVEIAEPEERFRAVKGCAFVLASSGTATLECALMGTPAIVSYRIPKLQALLMRAVLSIEHAALPNLVLGKEVFPELLQDDATPDKLARAAETWLDPLELDRVKRELAGLRDMFGELGAPKRAARIILDDLAALASGS